MKAIIQTGYGSPDFFEIREVDKPLVKDKQVLVKVYAAALHSGDVFCMRGIPYMTRFIAGWPKPKNYIPGYDFAGKVELVGRNVKQFKPGDEVFGPAKNTCAEHVCVNEKNLFHKPENLTFEYSAAIPISALAALQGLRDAGNMKSGQKVLITGASGGVGTFAVQIAKVFGGEVTGVCSTRNLDLVKSIGADHVIDYTQADFTHGDQHYDLILDQVANHTLSDCRRVLTPQGIHIPNSGHSGMGYILKAFYSSIFIRQQGKPFLSTPNNKDLVFLKELVETGKIKPVIDKTFDLAEITDAFRYLDEGNARGKVVLTVASLPG